MRLLGTTNLVVRVGLMLPRSRADSGAVARWMRCVSTQQIPSEPQVMVGTMEPVVLEVRAWVQQHEAVLVRVAATETAKEKEEDQGTGKVVSFTPAAASRKLPHKDRGE
jgi:hypothetical protein